MLSAIVDWLASVVGAMAVLCWCAGWVFGAVYLGNLAPLDGTPQRFLLATMGLGGLALSLILLKKIVGAKRL